MESSKCSGEAGVMGKGFLGEVTFGYGSVWNGAVVMGLEGSRWLAYTEPEWKVSVGLGKEKAREGRGEGSES